MPYPKDQTDVIVVTPQDDDVSLKVEAQGPAVESDTEQVRSSDAGIGTTFTYARQLTWTNSNDDRIDVRAEMVFKNTVSVAAVTHTSLPPALPQPAGVAPGRALMALQHRFKQGPDGAPVLCQIFVSAEKNQQPLAVVVVDPVTRTFEVTDAGVQLASGSLTTSGIWTNL